VVVLSGVVWGAPPPHQHGEQQVWPCCCLVRMGGWREAPGG
jgi:hypothetical protein